VGKLSKNVELTRSPPSNGRGSLEMIGGTAVAAKGARNRHPRTGRTDPSRIRAVIVDNYLMTSMIMLLPCFDDIYTFEKLLVHLTASWEGTNVTLITWEGTNVGGILASEV
jgi:hypothetical protein